MVGWKQKRGDLNSDPSHMEDNRTAIYLMYHRISQDALSYPYTVSARHFEQHLRLAKEIDNDACFLRPCFTFDDGHESVYSESCQLLAKYNRQAMFFLTAGWIGSRPGFLTWAQARTLKGIGHTIGSHGLSHKPLTKCSDAELQLELHSSKEAIQQRIGYVVDSISMPGGRWDMRVLRACVAAGYRNVFTSDPGAGKGTCQHIMVYPRLNVTQSVDANRLRELIKVHSRSRYMLRLGHRAKQLGQFALGDRLYHNLWCAARGWRNDEDVPGLT